MKCFAHPDVDAVGTCRNCSRGLCLPCVTLVDGKLSCKGACETELASFLRWVAWSRRRSGTVYRVAAIASAILALVALAVGVLAEGKYRPVAFGAALFFGLLTVLRVVQHRRWSAPRATSAQPASARGDSTDRP